jgi:hypothetical protein
MYLGMIYLHRAAAAAGVKIKYVHLSRQHNSITRNMLSNKAERDVFKQKS